MKQSKIFIASSTEGLDVATAVQKLLTEKLGTKIEINLWTQKFEYSKTFIESLEKATAENDFAILVLTADDTILSREQLKQSPRDNVIFELGLFMGSLGRTRCFFIHEDSSDIKIPTDLLGTNAAVYSKSQSDLKNALNDISANIAQQIETLGIRFKLTTEIIQQQAAVRNFCSKAEGYWWEKIFYKGINAISFFQIEADLIYNTISMSGKAFDADGNPVAKWKSLIARIDVDENKILYHWKGWHTIPELAHIPFHGFGEIEMDKPKNLQDFFTKGEGKFWDVDESNPGKTIIKPMQIHRITDSNIIHKMEEGNSRAVASILKTALDEW